MRIRLVNRSTKAINHENTLLKALMVTELEKLTSVEFNELKKEHTSLFEPPFVNSDEVEFNKLSDKDKVISNLVNYLFVTNEKIKNDYLFWQSCDLLAKQTYYSFGGLDLVENSNLKYSEFKDKFTHKNCYFVTDIGELIADLNYSRTADFIQLAYAQYLEYSTTELDKFIFINDADRILEQMSISGATAIFGSERYDVLTRRKIRNEYKEDEKLNHKLGYPSPKRPTEDLEIQKQIMRYDIIFKSVKLL